MTWRPVCITNETVTRGSTILRDPKRVTTATTLRLSPRRYADERATFERLLPWLRTRYPGQYVAICGGSITAHGPTRRDVARQFFTGGRPGPVYIGFVGDPSRVRQLSPFRSLPKEGPCAD